MMGALAIREQLAFRMAWLVGNSWLRFSAGKAYYTLPPSGPSAAIYRPVIVRLQPDITAPVALALERLRALGPQHHYYPPESMHVTIQALGPVLLNGPDSAARLAELRAIVGSHPGFDITLHGLNVSPATVFAQVIPHGPAFGRLRESLKALGRRSGLWLGQGGGFGTLARDLLPHANVVRFSGRVTADFLDELSRLRLERFGRCTVREVELVRTDSLLSLEGTSVLERIPLAMRGVPTDRRGASFTDPRTARRRS